MFQALLSPVEPPWYGPVRPVVWEGWRREVPPYPDLPPNFAVAEVLNAVEKHRCGTVDLLIPSSPNDGGDDADDWTVG